MAEGTHGTARIANERKRHRGWWNSETFTIIYYMDRLVIGMAERTESYRSIRQHVPRRYVALCTIMHA